MRAIVTEKFQQYPKGAIVKGATAKALMLLLEKLDEAAGRGATIDIHWYYDEEDDTMKELGQEFGEDLEHATFHLEVMRR